MSKQPRRAVPRPERSGPLTIDLYARISRSTDETRGRNVEGQVEDGLAAIAARGAQVGKTFRDESLSAWSPRVVRPQWEAMMARLESGEADGVWIYDLTRLTRKPVEGERLIAAAEKGLAVWSEWSEYDLTSADGRSSFRSAMNRAAGESDKISERSSRGKRKKALRGKSNATHRGFASPGYLPNGPDWEAGDPRVPVPETQVALEREAVREVAAMLLAGRPWREMAEHLNSAGHRTYTGALWASDSLRLMLMRPALAGIAEHQGEHLGVLPGEPGLDRETWDRVRATLAARKRGRPNADTYLLTGILRCGRCGHPLTGRPRASRSPYRDDGQPAREYHCQRRSGPVSGCGRLGIDQRFADGIVTAALLRRLGDPRHASRVARQAARVAEQRALMVVEVDRLNADADALADKVADWGATRVDRAMRPLLTRLETLREALAALEVPESMPEAASDALERWQALADDTTARRALVRRTFPDGITVDPASTRGPKSLDAARFDFAVTR